MSASTQVKAIRPEAPNAAGDPRWAKVVARDDKAEGTFFYSVATTGVYCRPSCPARLPNPKNVGFHATALEARAAGFRPCKRCRPEEPPQAARNAAIVATACRAIETADEVPGLAALAASAGLSTFHFHRLFKSVTGLTPKAYAAARRGARIRDELSSKKSVTEAIYDAGYNSSGRFYAASADVLGMKPRAYRAGGPAEEIRFAVGECSLGSILVARSGKGVCAILIGDEPDSLLRDLQDRFPKADMVGGDAEFEHLVAAVVGLVEAPGLGTELPLDVRGTAFQRRVWQALSAIPPGETASYTEIARRIGAPKAVRGVAQACAANKIAVAIPCHRVVRSDGALAGYRWGIERKRALLSRETNLQGGDAQDRNS